MSRKWEGQLLKDDMTILCETICQMNTNIDVGFWQYGSHKSQMSSATVVEVGLVVGGARKKEREKVR